MTEPPTDKDRLIRDIGNREEQAKATFQAALAAELDQHLAQLAAGLQHATEVFAPIFAELSGELVRLRTDLRASTRAAGWSAWALVGATIILALATVALVYVTAKTAGQAFPR